MASVVAYPFFQLKQVWSDYQNGRFIRKEVERSQYRCMDRQKANETEYDKTDNEANRKRRSWTMRLDHEYPWRIERDIQGDIGWKATWVLEVKDLHDIQWDTLRIHDGHKWRWHSVPQGHWPFPYDRTTVDDKGQEAEQEAQKESQKKAQTDSQQQPQKEDKTCDQSVDSEDTKC